MDRVPPQQASYPQPPPATNRGSNPDGSGPPRRDRRLSRCYGCDLVAAVSPAAFSGHQSAIGTTTGQLCTYDTGQDGNEDARTLFAFLKCYDFAENAVTGLLPGAVDPFKGSVSPVLPAGVLQSLEVLASLQWGTDGVSKQVIVSLPPGQIIKAGLAGTYARAHAKLSAKYFQRFQGANVGATEQYFYFDADPNVRNNVWNNLNSPALVPALGYSLDFLPHTPVHLDGILSLGDAVVPQGGSFDRSARPLRRFFGTLPAEGAAYPAGGAFVHCPVAFGASSVMLQCLGAAFVTPAGSPLSPLRMAMLDAAGDLIAEQPANTFVPLIAGCREVIVYNSAANGVENPFAILYDLGL